MAFRLIEKVLGSNVIEDLVATSTRASQFFIQAKRSNSNALEIGPESFVAGKGIEMVPPLGGEVLPAYSIVPVGIGASEDLANWKILGTIGEGVNIAYEEY